MESVKIATDEFLIVNGLIVIMIALSFAFIRRGPRTPVRLQLKENPADPKNPNPSGPPASLKPPENRAVNRAGSRAATASPTGGKASAAPNTENQAGPQTAPADHSKRRPPGWDSYRPRPRASSVEEADTQTDWRIQPTEKSLNVMFNWNGHSWDAYEVLGVPAGSSREAVHAALQSALQRCDPESVPFLKAAYETIVRN